MRLEALVNESPHLRE